MREMCEGFSRATPLLPSPRCEECDVECVMSSVWCRVHDIQCMISSVWCRLCDVERVMLSVWCRVCDVECLMSSVGCRAKCHLKKFLPSWVSIFSCLDPKSSWIQIQYGSGSTTLPLRLLGSEASCIPYLDKRYPIIMRESICLTLNSTGIIMFSASIFQWGKGQPLNKQI